MQIQKPTEVIVLNNTGSVRDISDVIRNTMATNGRAPSIILIDLPRDFEERHSIYTTIESLKNGRLTCTKYKGQNLLFCPPHIVVFSNWPPKVKLLSLDRWHIYNIHNKIMNKVSTKQLLKDNETYKNESSEEIQPIKKKDERKIIVDFDEDEIIDFIDSSSKSESSENEGTSSEK